MRDLLLRARQNIFHRMADNSVRIEYHQDVIRWYQHFIGVKLCRAVDARAREELEPDGEQQAFPRTKTPPP